MLQAEEEKGPSVNSADPEERILARRLRIQNRIEQQRREAMGEDDKLKKEFSAEEKKRKQQVETSRSRLENLKQDGIEMVTNVRVAQDAREMQHYVDSADAKQLRIEKLEDEAESYTTEYEELFNHWTASKPIGVPHILYKMLVEQRKTCNAIIGEKNNVISFLQMELKRKDEKYTQHLKNQSEDMDLLIEGMEEQVKNLTKSYRDELHYIEAAFIEERADILTNHRAKWEKGIAQRNSREEELLNMRFRRTKDQETQLEALAAKDTVEYNKLKIQLETDVQMLEQQLQQMKATYQLNHEKLEYNFQILKKRDEENTLTKSQQKRKLTRMQDALNSFRFKLKKQEKHYSDEYQNLIEEYKRITEQYKKLQKKMKYFSATDWKRFEDVWLMNEEEIQSIVEKVLKADEVIHQQQLGISWSPPALPFLKSSGPLEVQDPDPRPKATSIAKEILAGIDSSYLKMFSQSDEDRNKKDAALSYGVVKKILEVLCGEAGFLVEEKLTKLLQPLESDEKSLIRLDAIFKALSIESEEAVTRLSNMFHQHARNISKPTSAVGDVGISHEGKRAQRLSSDMNTTAVTSLPNSDCVVNPNHVLVVLKKFIDEQVKPTKESLRASTISQLPGSITRDSTLDEAHWESLANVISDKKLQLWDILSEALTKYHNVLSARRDRVKETESLREQNSELRMLLYHYFNSQVNDELVIPPTKILQLQ